MTRPPGFSICVPSVRATTIGPAIESIQRQSVDAWELIVVGQGDDDDLRRQVEAATARDARVRLVWLPVKGVSRARNAGARAATYDTIVFTDDDCEAAPDWLERIGTALDDDPSVGIVAGSLVAPPRPRWRIANCPSATPGDFTLTADPDRAELPPGSAAVSANLAVRQWAWETIGPFDELLGQGAAFKGGEDLDFILRALRHDVPIRFLPSAVVHHTYGCRFGLRAVLRILESYGSGQGAVAGKMSLGAPTGSTTWDGASWRRGMWRGAIVAPFRSLRPHQLVRSVPRLVAFERAYRRCLRDYAVDDAGLLAARPDLGTASA